MGQSECGNRLLKLMHDADYVRLAQHLEPIDLPAGTLITEANEPIKHMHFLESGVASLITRAPSGRRAEAGLIGREGFTIPALAMDVERLPHDSVMQVAGQGYRVEREIFIGISRESPSFLNLLLRFAQCLLVQMSYTVLSNAVHQIDVRLARWLLMLHDRSPADDLAITHEYIAVMLGVRRSSITDALHVLEGIQAIRSERGHVLIRNRTRLEEVAADAYGVPEAEYRRLIGPLS